MANILCRNPLLWLTCLLLPGISLADDFSRTISDIESQYGGRLGVAAFDSRDGRQLGYREHDTFAMCSTFKALLAAAVLKKAEQGQLSLDTELSYGKGDLLDYAPVTAAHVDEGQMTVSALAGAAITLSDNTAANLLLAKIGGPAGLTAYIRSLGDNLTRLDRTEPSLNTNLPGDPRDSTTPAAMVALWQKLLLGKALAPASRQQLLAWLKATQTGMAKIRAGLPGGWQAGDKTGSCENGGSNDVAIVWPSGQPPYLLAVYYSDGLGGSAQKNAAIAAVSQAVAEQFYPPGH
ncbi:class A beta-lactamase [Gallaecimonas pentaromativorans]|uniref:class A beta-lactamase n=1 Tax=Gallaecimonas pentaromativorans TaxID=584787 RepID=UPI003A920D91